MAISMKIKKMMESSSWIRKMFETGTLLKNRYGAENVYDFSLGNPNIDPPDEFRKALRETAADDSAGRHSYMPNAGYPDVRENVAAYISREQQTDISGSNVIMTCGAGGALNIALKAVLNPGDTVIASTPCFIEYRSYADNHGGNLEMVSCKRDFDLDIDKIEAAITAKTAAVIINSPNNPSGVVYPLETIEKLGIMLEKKGKETGRTIYLISDEPYRKIVFDGVNVPSVFGSYRNTMVATSYSKDLSIPGERIGWLAVNPDADDAADLVNGAVLCNRILGYVNAPAIMQRTIGRLQGIHADIDIYRRKRDLLCDSLERMGYSFLRPKGTFYLFPEAPGGDDLAFVNALQEERILTVPGRGFGMAGFFRIAFCVEDRAIEGAAAGFEKVFKRFA